MIPRVYVTVDGVPVKWHDVNEAVWESTLYLAADSLELQLNNREKLSDWLRKRQEVLFRLGYVKGGSAWRADELVFCFGGRIDAVRPKFGDQGETVRLFCRDYSAPLIDTAYSVAWAERTASQIAELLAAKYGLACEAVATTDILERDLFRDATEWEILQELAEREGYVCYVKKEKKLVFRPRAEEEIVARFVWRANVVDAEFDDSSVGVYNKVTVRHWTRKQKIEGSARDDALIDAMGCVKERIVYDARVRTPAQAQEEARRRLKELARPVVTAELVVVGDPALVAEKRVELAGFGRFSGVYYIERARHRYGVQGYTTELSLTNVRPADAHQYRQDLYAYGEAKM